MRRENPTFVCDECGLERPGYTYQDENDNPKEGVPLGWIILADVKIVVAAGLPKKVRAKHACSIECAADILTATQSAWATRQDAQVKVSD